MPKIGASSACWNSTGSISDRRTLFLISPGTVETDVGVLCSAISSGVRPAFAARRSQASKEAAALGQQKARASRDFVIGVHPDEADLPAGIRTCARTIVPHGISAPLRPPRQPGDGAVQAAVVRRSRFPR